MKKLREESSNTTIYIGSGCGVYIIRTSIFESATPITIHLVTNSCGVWTMHLAFIDLHLNPSYHLKESAHGTTHKDLTTSTRYYKHFHTRKFQTLAWPHPIQDFTPLVENEDSENKK